MNHSPCSKCGTMTPDDELTAIAITAAGVDRMDNLDDGPWLCMGCEGKTEAQKAKHRAVMKRLREMGE